MHTSAWMCMRWKGANRSSHCCCWGKAVHLKASLQAGTPTWWNIWKKKGKLKRYNGEEKGLRNVWLLQDRCGLDWHDPYTKVGVLSQTWGEIQRWNPNSLKQACIGWECCASHCQCHGTRWVHKELIAIHVSTARRSNPAMIAICFSSKPVLLVDCNLRKWARHLSIFNFIIALALLAG